MLHSFHKYKKSVFDKRIALQDSDNWDGYADTFTEDAVYVEHHEGTFEGKEAIRKWLVPIMALCKGWTFPIEWVVFEGDRIVYKWLNRLLHTQEMAFFHINRMYTTGKRCSLFWKIGMKPGLHDYYFINFTWRYDEQAF